MVAVNVVEGIKYGFRLIGYLIAVVVVAGILAAVGGAFMPGPFGEGGNIVLAVIFYVAAGLVYTAGFLGLLYKVIADGVEVGTLSAEAGGGPAGIGEFGAGGGQPPQPQRGGPPGEPETRKGRGGGQQRGGGGQPEGRQGGGHDAGTNQPPEDWEPGS